LLLWAGAGQRLASSVRDFQWPSRGASAKPTGLARIRVGWGGASAEVTDLVNRIREPFNVNILAQEAVIAALGDEDHLRVSTGSEEEMAVFAESFVDVVKGSW
jgi:histidinol-phosphate/aromatic aminotransferase/cobyric acid decarboxylase-like protein